jgi:hypothetical protein
MIKYKTPKQIEKELALLEKGETRSWGNIFLLLDSIDQTKYWIRGTDSFTRWVTENAFRFKLKPSILWRILSSGRFVRQISDKCNESGVLVPCLEELPNNVSPENIEILAKLNRVTPDETFLEFARKVFSGHATRAEMRSAWETYKPILNGQNARGRGVLAPRINKQDPTQYRALVEATMLDTLQTAGSSWTGTQSSLTYKVFLHVNPQGYNARIWKFLFSAVAVVKPSNGNLQYHGIRFRYGGNSLLVYKEPLAYCDYLWVFSVETQHDLRGGNVPNIVLDIPDGIGILDIKDGAVTVVRPARVVEGAGSKRVDLADELLVRTLRTK